MLPVVRGAGETRGQILAYSVVLAAATLLLYYPLQTLGGVYLAAAGILNGLFVALAVAVARGRAPWAPAALFGYSIVYLALLFGAMVADRLLLGWSAARRIPGRVTPAGGT